MASTTPLPTSSSSTNSFAPLGQIDGAVVETKLERGFYVPTSIATQGLISGTNSAYDCFTGQAFSSKLQMFLINYVVSVSGYYAVYVS